eukprot:3594844-Pleurochrysis_carterae.AAC.2
MGRVIDRLAPADANLDPALGVIANMRRLSQASAHARAHKGSASTASSLRPGTQRNVHRRRARMILIQMRASIS